MMGIIWFMDLSPEILETFKSQISWRRAEDVTYTDISALWA